MALDLLTDKEMLKRVDKLAKLAPTALWSELIEMGNFFALIGATTEALTVWDLAAHRTTPERRVFMNNDSIEGWRVWERGVRHYLDPSVPGCGAQSELSARIDFTSYARTKGLLPKAQKLARPLENGDLPSTELEALDLYTRALASSTPDNLDRVQAGPIMADIAARHGRKEEAIAILRRWYEFPVKNLREASNCNFRGWFFKMSSLPAVVALICKGALSEASGLTPKKRADLIAQIEAGIAAAKESLLPKLKREENGLVLRTDFSNDAAWERICKEIRQSYWELYGDESDPIEFVSDPHFDGMTTSQLNEATTNWDEQSHLFAVDAKTIKDKKHRVLIIDLGEEPGRTHRVLPERVGPIFSELSTDNASWEEVVDNGCD